MLNNQNPHVSMGKLIKQTAEWPIKTKEKVKSCDYLTKQPDSLHHDSSKTS